MLYQISWRAARKADKHGEYGGGQQLNSVLTLQLMGFFCCSNEIFCRDVGKYVLKQADVVHIHPSADNIRPIKEASTLKEIIYIHIYIYIKMQFFFLTLGAKAKTLHFKGPTSQVRLKVHLTLAHTERHQTRRIMSATQLTDIPIN